ncbi:ribonuclease inhibitor isoform X2 [Dromiciops gliroides]|uniref:ribonuclease inhibitor isoform X2 n=1 Tax=Dromiciops gliroides TaxID=33562 RepID=UPI001CC53753|nr:ribonuclease inhibitor isoform X2 [Dromiciops gliroides]
MSRPGRVAAVAGSLCVPRPGLSSLLPQTRLPQTLMKNKDKTHSPWRRVRSQGPLWVGPLGQGVTFSSLGLSLQRLPAFSGEGSCQNWEEKVQLTSDTPSPTMSLEIQCEDLSSTRWTEILPSMQQYGVIRLDDCGLTDTMCANISSVLQANSSLTELSLPNNELKDEGAQLVLKGLQNPNCKIQKLSLQNCSITGAGCELILSLLRTKPTLRDLQLSDNHLGDEGMKLLCEGLMDPRCSLERLELEYCEVTTASCEALSSVLKAKGSLQELTLNNNELGEAGVVLLCQGLMDPNCKLQVLKLEGCGVTSANCKDLSMVLQTKESLQELCLGENKIGDAGLAQLYQGVLSPTCRLKTLWLWECDITAEGCKVLAQILMGKPCLKKLSLICNLLGDEGAELLCQALVDPNCQLEELWLRTCGFTTASCANFCTVLEKNRTLRELQLSTNMLEDDGIEQMSRGLMHPDCSIQSLWLGDCELSDKCCGTLAAILLANHTLKELDLSNNRMGDEGIRLLVASLKEPSCTLEQLVLFDIYWTEEVDNELTALKESKPSLRITS